MGIFQNNNPLLRELEFPWETEILKYLLCQPARDLKPQPLG